jgi:hypothetical protein
MKPKRALTVGALLYLHAVPYLLLLPILGHILLFKGITTEIVLKIVLGIAGKMDFFPYQQK